MRVRERRRGAGRAAGRRRWADGAANGDARGTGAVARAGAGGRRRRAVRGRRDPALRRAVAAGEGAGDRLRSRRRAHRGRPARGDGAGCGASAAGARPGAADPRALPGRPPADALEAFRAARARLVEEIGSEPGPELRRLHGRSCTRAPSSTRPRASAPHRGGRLRGRPGAAWRSWRRRSSRARRRRVVGSPWAGDEADTAIVENSVALIDPASGAVEADEEVGRGPTAVATGAGSVWVANGLDGTVTRIDRSRNQKCRSTFAPRPARSRSAPARVVAADDRASPRSLPRATRSSNESRSAASRARSRSATAGLGREPRDGWSRGSTSRAPGHRSGSRRARAPLRSPPAPGRVGGGFSGELVRLEPRSGNATASINVGNGPGGVAVGAGLCGSPTARTARSRASIRAPRPRRERSRWAPTRRRSRSRAAMCGPRTPRAGAIARVEPGRRVTATRRRAAARARSRPGTAHWAATPPRPPTTAAGGSSSSPASAKRTAWNRRRLRRPGTLTLAYDDCSATAPARRRRRGARRHARHVGPEADRRRPHLRVHASPRHPLLHRAAGARGGRACVDRTSGGDEP